MKKVNAMEMRAVEGGATYSKKCKYCGKKYSASYWGWSWIAKQAAKTSVNIKVHNHETSCFAKNNLGW